MDAQSSSSYTIDNCLYHLYTDIEKRKIEKDASMSLDEKQQFKAILTCLKEIDGNLVIPIVQDVFQDPTTYGKSNCQKPLLEQTQSIEQEVLDTAVTESATTSPESHQAHKSMTGSRSRRAKRIVKTSRIHRVTTRSQASSIKSHTASTEYHPPSTGHHITSTENHTAMNSSTSAANAMQAFQPITSYTREEKHKTIIAPFANATGAGLLKGPLDEILLHQPRKEIQYIKAHPQRSSAVFRMRMNAISGPKSAEEKAFLDTFDVRDVLPIYKKPMSEFISLLSNGHQTQLNKCRQMLCAYQIARITDQLLRESSHDGDKIKQERKIYRQLNAAIVNNRFNYCLLMPLCTNSLYLVEHVGVHILFVPEVISPAIVKTLDKDSVESLAKHLVDEWPNQFKKLARFSHFGDIVVSRNHTDDTMSEKNEDYPGHFLKGV
ncbi:hypothetical protein MBANPS3_007224 [Mucor bainieri]